ncbi:MULTISPECIES: hypothetical protein [unclassified Rhizobium]|jgi:hypothetical protein|nr:MULTISPECIES: hypothetical protein [unclassified Rhizobium]MBN8950500.1 hypothetical protein [Rhizobium tropici]
MSIDCNGRDDGERLHGYGPDGDQGMSGKIPATFPGVSLAIRENYALV